MTQTSLLGFLKILLQIPGVVSCLHKIQLDHLISHNSCPVPDTRAFLKLLFDEELSMRSPLLCLISDCHHGSGFTIVNDEKEKMAAQIFI